MSASPQLPSPAAFGHPPAACTGPWLSEATFNGGIAILARPRSELEALLPRGLSLASPRVEADVHPLVVMFGDQTRGTLLTGPRPLPLDYSYGETSWSIPYVRKGGSTEDDESPLYTFALGMHCDRRTPAVFGNANYGFNKRLARISWRGPALEVQRDQSLVARYHLGKGSSSCGDAELFASIAAFRLPILGRKSDGSFGRCHFQFGLGKARVLRAHTRLELPEHLDGLSAGRYLSAPGHSFEVQGLRWRISWPARA